MNSSTWRRKIIVLLLGSALVATATAAADLRSPAFRPPLLPSQGTPGLLECVAAFLGIFWEKEGGSIDPNGQATGAGEEGGSLDPYGQSTGAGEEGGSLDPNGGR